MIGNNAQTSYFQNGPPLHVIVASRVHDMLKHHVQMVLFRLYKRFANIHMVSGKKKRKLHIMYRLEQHQFCSFKQKWHKSYIHLKILKKQKKTQKKHSVFFSVFLSIFPVDRGKDSTKIRFRAGVPLISCGEKKYWKKFYFLYFFCIFRWT